MKNISFENINITGGFWLDKQNMLVNKTLPAVYERFCETHRFDALKCNWKEKDGEEKKPHIFYDSDVAKWIEGASYVLQKKRDKALEKIIDEAVDDIVANSTPDGYFNSHFLVTRPYQRFTHREEHELYCLGHLIEAAVAYFRATGKRKFLDAMCRYADLVEKIFMIEKSASFSTPGHPELELALVKLYEETGEKRYLELACHFIDVHGTGKENLDPKRNFYCGKYNMDEMPLRQRTTVDGHAVRALYLLAGAADVARHKNDALLADACKRVFDNCTQKRMYITGGVGSTYIGEAFTVDYDLQSRRAYTETCASAALVFFANRMILLDINSKYDDIIEKVIYNGLLSGVSMDGEAFFYENPLEIDPDFNDVNFATPQKERFPSAQRQKVFSCSCCPPNIVRFISSVANYMYTLSDDTLYVRQYMDSHGEFDGICITQSTDYPCDGNIKITCKSAGKRIALRIPKWCKSFTVSVPYTMENGYAVVSADTTDIELKLEMPIYFVRSNPRVHDNAGRVALMRGPAVYCLEGVDNGKNLRNVKVSINGEFVAGQKDFLLPSILGSGFCPVPTEELYPQADDCLRQIPLKFIPYFAFANRGVSELQVWILEKD